MENGQKSGERTVSKRKKVVIAAGGTGGHLFPAQALADELKKADVDVVFMGAGLNENRYFDRGRHCYVDIPSATVFRRNPLVLVKSLLLLAKGIRQSVRRLREESPDLVVGFGSFHAFPILFAAHLQKAPIALFESNAFPGKVNRLFASFAAYTAVVFPKAREHLKGKAIEVAMPVRQAAKHVSIEIARAHFGLDPLYPAVLIFGGSQGALAMNELVVKSIEILRDQHAEFQVIHITGRETLVEQYKQAYASLKIRACVKAFEAEMPTAYQAASCAVCRAGAATVSELIAFEVPSILIPFPYAADDHQAKNALFVQNEVKGGVCLLEKGLTKEVLALEIHRFLDPSQSKMIHMKKALGAYKLRQDKKELCQLICETLSQR